MFKHKPWIRLVTDEVEGGDSTSTEEEVDAAQEDADTETPDGEEKPEDSAEEWDRDRALAKIRKSNAEAKTQRERAKAAEAKLANAGDAEDRAAKAEAKAARLEIALELGIPANIAHRLQGDTPEELRADAEDLLQLFASKGTPSNKPRPKLGHLQGGTTPGQEAELDAEAIVKKALGK